MSQQTDYWNDNSVSLGTDFLTLSPTSNLKAHIISTVLNTVQGIFDIWRPSPPSGT